MAMIEVDHLTKRYGGHFAVRDISFAVDKGEIVGFLGRNGAGKTTTMRVLAGSLGATEGRASIGDLDVSEKPREVKRLLGYLPESPPLYTDMTVRSYLDFCARIKEAKEPAKAVERAIEQVALKDVAHRLIEHLSKGYRQRVGIAQALVHSPKVLVLDEPVSGLDPVQRQEILDLVRGLASGDVTVMLSTHVLAEIEPVCKRVIIIDRGKIVAQDTIANLANIGGAVAITVARPSDGLLTALRAISGVTEALHRGQGEYVVRGNRDVREDVARAAVDAGLLALRGEQGLQDVFLRLIGEA
jgi:ABC-2 type transport system ATP-binding protein